MQAAQLSSSLRQWAAEFASITGEPVQVPERLWPFLAQRLTEIGVGTPDPDVLSVKLGDVCRKVRITGRRGPMLCYESVDGSKGFGMVNVGDVHAEDRGRLTDILERMPQSGGGFWKNPTEPLEREHVPRAV